MTCRHAAGDCPHFRDPQRLVPHHNEAPSPLARFPASKEGWAMALDFAAFQHSLWKA